MENALYFAGGLLTGVIGLWAVNGYVISWLWLAAAAFGGAAFGFWAACVVMAGGKAERENEIYDRGYVDGYKAGKTPIPTWESYQCCYRAIGDRHADYCPTRAGEWATPENVAQAEERLTS